jgi:uncharacterized protein (TIGR02996 family)
MSAWLKIFDSDRFTAQKVELPEAGLTIGRPPGIRPQPLRVEGSPFAFEGSDVRKVARIVRENGHWVLKALDGPVAINGQPVSSAVLHQGDLIGAGAQVLGFGDRLEVINPALEAQIARSGRELEEPWLVYADWLQEQSDPLGARIAGATVDDDAWLDGLWRESAAGDLEVQWRRGMIEAAVLRSSQLSRGWPALILLRLVELRAARFLRELTIDLGALHRSARPEAAARLVAGWVAKLPPMPALERLSFGYCLGQPQLEPILLPEPQRPRFPRLDPTAPLFDCPARAVLEVLAIGGPVEGANAGDRLEASGCHFAANDSGVLVDRGWAARGRIEQRCRIVPGGLRSVLVTGREKPRIEVNGRQADQFELLPGDRIDVWSEPRGQIPSIRLRFALDAGAQPTRAK